jgi:hypothetical protein
LGGASVTVTGSGFATDIVKTAVATTTGQVGSGANGGAPYSGGSTSTVTTTFNPDASPTTTVGAPVITTPKSTVANGAVTTTTRTAQETFAFGGVAATGVTCPAPKASPNATVTTSCTVTTPAGTLGSVVPVTSTNLVTASPAPAPYPTYNYIAGALTSMHFVANSSATVTQNLLAGASPSCTPALAAQYAQVTGTDIYSDYDLSLTSFAGNAWLDTGGTSVSGCSEGLDQESTFPAGTTAGGGTSLGRLGTFTEGGITGTLLGFPINGIITKTGTITCPTGFTMLNPLLGALGTLFSDANASNTTDWLCPVVPVNTGVPTITFSPTSSAPYVGSTLTTKGGTWTPTNETSTTTEQWYRIAPAAGTPNCVNTPASCTAITGATGTSYTTGTADLGDSIEVIATNTNEDGSASWASAQTSPVVAPPTPSFTAAPVVTVSGPDTLSTTNGTLATGGVPVTYSYQWYLCNPSATCNPLGSPTTTNTYTVTPAGSDVGDYLEVKVSAVNTVAGGTAGTSLASNQFLVPSATITVTAGTPTFTGTTTSVGKVLTATTGTWSPAGDEWFSYQWMTCTALTGGTCTDSTGTGATTNAYTTVAADNGGFVEVVVTGTDFSGSPSAIGTSARKAIT